MPTIVTPASPIYWLTGTWNGNLEVIHGRSVCGFNDYTAQLRAWAPLCMCQCVCLCAESVKQIVWGYKWVCRDFHLLAGLKPRRTLQEHWEEYQLLSNLNPRATFSLHCPITDMSAIVYASMCMCLYVWILPKVYGGINRSVVQVFRLLCISLPASDP